MLLTFEEAVGQTDSKNRLLLLGNGFSRACLNDLFSYDALFEEAKDKLSDTAKLAFEALGTTDFESVMKALQQAETLINAYVADCSELAVKLAADAELLRDILAQVISSNHPDRVDDISHDSFLSCRHFLKNFKKIYTLNYDLLLYWALMQSELDDLDLKGNDGFRMPKGGPEEYVVWDYGDAFQQNIFYLHGALHIVDAGSEIRKYTWSNTGVPLIEQIRESLNFGRYPIYVSEGTSDSKMDRILHNSFLIRGYRSLAEIGGSLFIFGHSLSSNDEHVLRSIERNKVNQVFVSIFGDVSSQDNQRIVGRALALKEGRSKLAMGKKKKDLDLDVKFFDAESACVWG